MTDRSQQNKQVMKIKADRERAMLWLSNTAKVSPLGKYLTGCILCGKDSNGNIRCDKHQRKYEDIFYRTTQEFTDVFKGQL